MRPNPHARLILPSFECGCGQIHNSADGQLPVGWTQRAGTVWCADCTRAGIPTRTILNGTRPRRASKAA